MHLGGIDNGTCTMQMGGGEGPMELGHIRVMASGVGGVASWKKDRRWVRLCG